MKNKKKTKEEECSHECEGCPSASTCDTAQGKAKGLPEKSKIDVRHVILVLSGKGGVDSFDSWGDDNAVFLANYRPAKPGKGYTGHRWVGRSRESDAPGIVRHEFRWIQEQCARRNFSVTELPVDRIRHVWLLVAKEKGAVPMEGYLRDLIDEKPQAVETIGKETSHPSVGLFEDSMIPPQRPIIASLYLKGHLTTGCAAAETVAGSLFTKAVR